MIQPDSYLFESRKGEEHPGRSLVHLVIDCILLKAVLVRKLIRKYVYLVPMSHGIPRNEDLHHGMKCLESVVSRKFDK